MTINYGEVPLIYSKTIKGDYNSLSVGNWLKFDYVHPCPPEWLWNYQSNPPQSSDEAVRQAIRAWVTTSNSEPRDCSPATASGFVSSPTPTPPAAVGPTATPFIPPVSGQPWQDWEWNWQMMDETVKQAKALNVQVFGHTFVWHIAIPGWVSAIPRSHPQYADIINHVMQEHIDTVIRRYCQPEFILPNGKPVVYAYDVANEAVDAGTGKLYNPSSGGVPIIPWAISTAEAVTTTNYVSRAFVYAENSLNSFPSNHPCRTVKLIYNEKDIEDDTPHGPPNPEGVGVMERGIYQLITTINSGRPQSNLLVDGIGFQMHISMYPETNPPNVIPTTSPGPPAATPRPLPVNFNEANLQRMLNRFATLGLEVKILEADVTLRRWGARTDCRFNNYPPGNPNRGDCSIPGVATYFAHATPVRSQSYVYTVLARLCRNTVNHKCTGFTTWGVQDASSHLNCFHPLPFQPYSTPILVPCPSATPTPSSFGEFTPTPTHIPYFATVDTIIKTPTLDPYAVATVTWTPTRTPTPWPTRTRYVQKPAYNALADVFGEPPSPTPGGGGYPAPLIPTPTAPYGIEESYP